MSHRLAGPLVIVLALHTAAAQEAIQDPIAPPIDPARAGSLSLEELMNLEVTSVAGVQQQVRSTPAAIDVITGEDLRRSGHRSLAEALRLSPGVFVGKSKSHSWSIAPRGFNGLLANKTLVLMDGRRLYDPLHGGTFWDVQDVLLEDVDRIEVIRGPGATLWGANAVNGVINIISKRTDETQGVHANVGVGTYERAFGAFRYGGQFSENAWYSVWGRYINRAALEAEGPDDGDDQWDFGRGRFRTDIRLEPDTWLMLQADAYSTFTHSDRGTRPIPAETPTTERREFDNYLRGGHLLGRLERLRAPNDGWSVLTYYDYTHRDQSDFEVTRHSFEIDARYLFTLGERHALIAGVEYFFTSDDTNPSATIELDPGSRDRHTIGGFIQDTITLVPDRWFALLGTKLEYNEQTRFELQPSARLWFTPDSRQTIWGAVSRSVRIPSRLEEDVIATLSYLDPGVVGGGEPTGVVPIQFFPNRDLESEKIISYELGYRNQLTERLSVDVAGFYNDYDDLVSLPRTLAGATFTNDGSAETYGGEISLNWRIADNWRIRGSYSYVEVDVHGPVSDADEGNTPHNMANLRSYLDVTEDLEFNAAAYFVDRVPSLGVGEYVRLDLGVTWHITPHSSVAIWGQNLLDERHREFSTERQVERSVYLMASFKY